jgi:hypothetical protein
MTNRQELVREGVIVGVLGAMAVALWFLLVDTLAGVPLQTPVALGGALLGGVPGSSDTMALVGYTAFHFGAFMGVGILASYSTRLAERRPHVLALFLLLFFSFQAGFYGLTTVLEASRLFPQSTWLQIAVGNLLATMAMGTYLWRRHPVLRRNLEIALAG